ncbi:hypothetical protein C7N43_23360 [Sphingobacteriales bacterium UPWRP_1]|nr:hypothetical protein BVG80_07505 [Sphingobacteriales bacterium TSM_CSM]PSJ74581.1 hypothetical protein C7N43_23360 [Sphingobacteriales bacterium UPWRP_1]
MGDWYFVASGFGQLIIYLITIIFLASAAIVVKELLRFVLHENEALQQMQDNFVYLDKQTQTLAQSYGTLVKNCLPGIAVNRAESIYLIAMQQQPVVHSTLTDNDVLRENASAASNFLRYARSAMVMLGLFGTFYGLSQMVGQIRVVFDEINTDTIRQLLESYSHATQSMKTILAPMKDAFLTSFWGLLGTIVLGLLLLPLNWVKQQFFSRLETLTATRLIPFFNPPQQEALVAQLVDKVTLNTQMVNDIARSMQLTSEHLAADFTNLRQFTANLKTSIDSYIQAQDALSQTITAMHGAVNAMTANTGQGTETYKIAEALNLHNATIAQLTDRLYNTEFSFSDWLKEIIALSQQQHLQLKEELKSMIELSRSNLSNTQSASNRFDISTKKFKDTLDSLEQMLNTFAAMVQEAVQKEVLKLDELGLKLQGLQDLMRNLNMELPTQLSRMAGTLDTTNKLANPKYVEQIARAMADEAIQKQIAEYAREYQRLEEQINALEQRLAEQKKSRLPGFVQQILKFFGLK